MLAIALGMLGLMAYGERWMLEHPATAANELIVATCVIDAVFGPTDQADVCTTTGMTKGKEGRL